MRSLFFTTLLFFSTITLMAQNELPLREIPPAPQELNVPHVLARMVQGLGYRYYWASKDLRPQDLDYRPSKEAASCLETLQHIYGLAEVIANTTQSKASIRPLTSMPSDYETLRTSTLSLLHKAEEAFLLAQKEEVEAMNVIFERGGKQAAFPLWNLINGPVSDAIYHTGQVVSFRRTTGNPIQKGVNVFLGKTKQ